MPKDSYIRIRLTAEEKQEIKEAAESDRKKYIVTYTRREKTKGVFRNIPQCHKREHKRRYYIFRLIET